MATYAELRTLFADNLLRNKVEVACIIAAETIRGEGDGVTNHNNRMLWAKAAFSSPRGASDRMLMALLAANNTADVAVITGASDSQIQEKVDAAVNVFADGS